MRLRPALAGYRRVRRLGRWVRLALGAQFGHVALGARDGVVLDGQVHG
jgi:hypothetical protein